MRQPNCAISKSRGRPEKYICTQRDFSVDNLTSWFCRVGNKILSLDRTHRTHNPTWICTKGISLEGRYNNEIRPDFVLASTNDAANGTTSIPWASVLIVGNHTSAHLPLEFTLAKSVQCAQQVFVSQPFRNAVIGLLTANDNSTVSFWRFDRGGGIGSVPLNYGATKLQLLEVILCLHTLPGLGALAMGFHTSSISWDGTEYPYPQAESVQIMGVIDDTKNDDKSAMGKESLAPSAVSANVIEHEKLVFVSPDGLLSRATRVWRGHLRTSNKGVIIKYSWRDTCRPPEIEAYEAAQQCGVIGLAQFLSYDIYEKVSEEVRGGLTPENTHLSTDAYNLLIGRYDRTYTRLVLGTVGVPLTSAELSPLQVAQGLLGGLMGHASLFFDARILHRDISPSNILYCPDALDIPSPRPEICGNQTTLRGCMIDLDFAIDVTKGAEDRTGTYPFIAVDILRGRCQHRYRHDLESFLYVLIWMACYRQSPPPVSTRASTPGYSMSNSSGIVLPGNPYAPIALVPEPGNVEPLVVWRMGGEANTADAKELIIHRAAEFERVLDGFRPGYEPFKSAARGMRKVLWCMAGNYCYIFPEDLDDSAHSVRPDEVRPGVSNLLAFRELRVILEELVQSLGQAED